MAINAATMATDMDTLSDAFEGHDVDPDTMETDATLRTAALRLQASFCPWMNFGGLARPHQPHSEEVQLPENDYRTPDIDA